MNTKATLTVCAFLATNILVGCNSIKGLASSNVDPDDPLSGIRKASPTYRLAKRELDSSASATVMKFARWQEDLGEFEEAKSQYLDVLADNPENVEARLGVARVEYKSGHKVEAEKILAATTRKFPDSTDAWMGMGRVFSSQEKWDEAVASFRGAVKITPKHRLANYELGVALARTDQLEDAHRYLAVAGGDSAACYNIGYILHESGKSRDAAEWSRKALASNPDDKTRTSAQQLLTTLGRTLTPQDANTRVAANTPPFIDQQKTTFRHFTESPGQDGFVPASMQIKQSTPGVIAQSPGTSPGNVRPAPWGNSRASTVEKSFAIRTANMQRTNAPLQSQSGIPDWNGPSSTVQSQAIPKPVLKAQAKPTVEPPAWRPL